MNIVNMKIYNYLLLCFCIISFGDQIIADYVNEVNDNAYGNEDDTDVREVNIDIPLIHSKEYDTSCPWEYNYRYSLPIKTISFDEFRNSRDQALRVSDIFGTTVLSSMFVDRKKFSIRWETDTWIQYLDLSSNKFEKILPNTFDPLSYCLQYLLLNNNRLVEIDNTIFDELKELHYLDLSINKLKIIKPSLWFSKIDLDYLNVSYNDIDQIVPPTISIRLYKTIAKVDISHNKLQNFSDIEFGFNVNFLNLSYNMIQEIEFVNSSELYDLNLAHNQLKSFHCVSLKNVSNLMYLNLSFNKITTFKCSNMFNLTVIDLTENRLRHLRHDTFNNLNALTHLYLANNKIIPKPNMFKKLQSLKYLNLQNNNFRTIPVRAFNGLYELISLILSHNKLTYFKFGTFAGVHRLEVLDLSNNQIDWLDFNKLTELDNLRVLFLDDNPLSGIDLSDLNFKLNKLTTISLNNMSWRCDYLAKVKIELRKINVSLKIVPYINNESSSSINGIKCITSDEDSEDLMLQDDEEQTEYTTTEISIENPFKTTEVDVKLNNYLLTTTERNINNHAVDSQTKNTSLSRAPWSVLLEKIEKIIANETAEIKDDLTELKNLTRLIKNKIFEEKDSSHGK